jgi:hypothetical protein
VLDPAGPAARVDHDRDHVEADRPSPRSRVAAPGKPFCRKPTQAPALTWTEPEERVLVWADRTPAARAARLDLHEHDREAVSRDQVDLAVARAHVAREHGVAMAVKPPSGHGLALRAERAPAVFAHGCDATTRL